jgi:hypothetical protein
MTDQGYVCPMSDGLCLGIASWGRCPVMTSQSQGSTLFGQYEICWTNEDQCRSCTKDDEVVVNEGRPQVKVVSRGSQPIVVQDKG